MKKISEKQKKQAALLAYKRWRHNLLRAQKRKLLRIQRLVFERTGGEYIPVKYNLDAPSQFNFVNENFDEIIKFLRMLRTQSLVAKGRYSVNFKTIQEISPIAALILTAEIDRWRRIKRAKLRPAELRKWNPTVRRLLNEMGFFEVLEIENPCLPEDTIADKEVEFIKFISGNKSDGSYAKQLRQSLEKVAGTINTKAFMYTGLTEAMTNSVTHAYPEDTFFHPDLNKRWWMSGSYNKKTGRMFVMVYDQGVGIPTTLPFSRFWNVIYGFLSSLGLASTDGNLIKGAMQIGRTQTCLENRGLGLNEMKDFINRSGKGVLRIISGRGDYLYYSTGREEVRDHEKPLEGTLIAWEIYTKDENE